MVKLIASQPETCVHNVDTQRSPHHARSSNLVFSERMLSPVRLSVVCNVRAPYSGGSNFRQYLYGIRYLGHPLTSTVTLNDLERHNGRYFALFQRIRIPNGRAYCVKVHVRYLIS